MQKLIWGIALACAGLVLAVGDVSAGSRARVKAAKEPDMWIMRSEKFLGCAEFQASKADGSQGDFLAYKCVSQFGPPMWMVIHDGTRYEFGFGKTENSPQMADGDAEGAIEWWGKTQKGKFVPRSVIKRYVFSDHSEPEKRTKQLVVFRLLQNGKSCVLSVVDHSQTENDDARKLAFGNTKCRE